MLFESGNLELVKALIYFSGCEPNKRDRKGNTPLHEAARQGNLPMMKMLIEQYGLNPYQINYDGKSILDLAENRENEAGKALAALKRNRLLDFNVQDAVETVELSEAKAAVEFCKVLRKRDLGAESNERNLLAESYEKYFRRFIGPNFIDKEVVQSLDVANLIGEFATASKPLIKPLKQLIKKRKNILKPLYNYCLKYPKETEANEARNRILETNKLNPDDLKIDELIRELKQVERTNKPYENALRACLSNASIESSFLLKIMYTACKIGMVLSALAVIFLAIALIFTMPITLGVMVGVSTGAAVVGLSSTAGFFKCRQVSLTLPVDPEENSPSDNSEKTIE